MIKFNRVKEPKEPRKKQGPETKDYLEELSGELSNLQKKLNKLFSRLPEAFNSLSRRENLPLPIKDALNLPPELLAKLVQRFQEKIKELEEKIRKTFGPIFDNIFNESGEIKIKHVLIGFVLLLLIRGWSFLINLMQDLTSTLESGISSLSWVIPILVSLFFSIYTFFSNEWINRIIQTGTIPDLSQIRSDIERNMLIRERDRFFRNLRLAGLIIIFFGPWGLGTHLLTLPLRHFSEFLGQLLSPVSSLEAQFYRIMWLLIGEFSELVDLLSKFLSNFPPQS